MSYRISDKLRYFIKKLPFTEELYDFLAVTFFPDYSEDGIRTFKNSSFVNDKLFIKGYNALLKQEPGAKKRWRAHVTQWAGFQALKVPGDFVETGVDRASFSASLMEYISFKDLTDRNFYLIDTYEGLVAELIQEEEKNAALKNEYSPSYEFVKKTFEKLPNVKVIKGIVPDVLATLDINKVAYLSIDMNCAAPERQALEHFWPKLSQGGIVVLDDYAWPGRGLQKKTADEFAESVGHKILTIPTGQGIIIKQ
jgi:hypothetical protein